MLAIYLEQNGEKFPDLGDSSLNRHTSALTEFTDWSAVFKFRREHVTSVSIQTSLKPGYGPKCKFECSWFKSSYQLAKGYLNESTSKRKIQAYTYSLTVLVAMDITAVNNY